MSTTSIIVHTGRLSPLSVGTVSLVQRGTDDLQQIELIQLLQNPYAFSNPANPLPSAGYAITPVQVGTSDRPDIQRITLTPAPYDGQFNFTYDGNTYTEVPYNISTKDLGDFLGANYAVAKKASNSWQIKKIANGAVNPITVDVSQLIVPIGKQGTLSLNVPGIYLAFVASQAKVLLFTFEVQLQYPGQDPQTIFQDTIEVSRNVINLNNIAAATLLALQTSYTALIGDADFSFDKNITGLVGGGTNLDAVTTAEKTLGYRYDFWLNNALNTFKLVAGAADVADPTGQVSPLDYDAGTNNKHWERQG